MALSPFYPYREIKPSPHKGLKSYRVPVRYSIGKSKPIDGHLTVKAYGPNDAVMVAEQVAAHKRFRNAVFGNAILQRATRNPSRKTTRAKRNPSVGRIVGHVASAVLPWNVERRIVASKLKRDAKKKPSGMSNAEWIRKRYPRMRPEQQRFSARYIAKRNPSRRWVIRGFASRRFADEPTRNFWYFTGDKFSRNRRAAKSYPSEIAATGEARRIQNRLPFQIYGIEVVRVGK